jgi:hypothetical protein
MLVSISRTAGKCLIGVEGGDVAVLVTVSGLVCRAITPFIVRDASTHMPVEKLGEVEVWAAFREGVFWWLDGVLTQLIFLR